MKKYQSWWYRNRIGTVTSKLVFIVFWRFGQFWVYYIRGGFQKCTCTSSAARNHNKIAETRHRHQTRIYIADGYQRWFGGAKNWHRRHISVVVSGCKESSWRFICRWACFTCEGKKYLPYHTRSRISKGVLPAVAGNSLCRRRHSCQMEKRLLQQQVWFQPSSA